jgi:very-short-patch-repair endonuclease
MPPAEAALWQHLRAGRTDGVKFARQVPAGPYVLDFAARAVRLAIEIDGWSHTTRQGHDKRRTAWLEAQGWRLLRFSNADVRRDVVAVAMTAAREARAMTEQSIVAAPVRLRGAAVPRHAAAGLAGPATPIPLPSIAALDHHGWHRVLVEGGGVLAGALLAADRVDRLLIYRAPIIIGDGRGIAFALQDLAAAHGRWRLIDRRALGDDSLEEYRRTR